MTTYRLIRYNTGEMRAVKESPEGEFTATDFLDVKEKDGLLAGELRFQHLAYDCEMDDSDWAETAEGEPLYSVVLHDEDRD